MSTNFNSGSAVLGTTPTVIYTAPSNVASSVFYGFSVANVVDPASGSQADIQAAQRQLTLAIYTSAGAQKVTLGRRLPVPTGSTINFARMKVTLKPGESVRAFGDQAGLEANASILENIVDV